MRDMLNCQYIDVDPFNNCENEFIKCLDLGRTSVNWELHLNVIENFVCNSSTIEVLFFN
jgi:hypothetical protein